MGTVKYVIWGSRESQVVEKGLLGSSPFSSKGVGVGRQDKQK